MQSINKYEAFLEEARKPLYFRIDNNTINIYIDEFIKTFKERFNLGCWFLYNNRDSVSLQYYEACKISDDDIMKIKSFMFDNAPYFIDILFHKDDHRIVIRFIDVGDPIRFKFYH